MLLARTSHRGAQGRDEVLARATAFQRGEWRSLLAAARRSGDACQRAEATNAETAAQPRRATACAKVRRGEVSRAPQVRTSAELAGVALLAFRACEPSI